MLTKMDLAKSKIALHSAAFISLVSKLAFEDTDTLPTAATDGRRVMYNSATQWYKDLTLGEAIGLVLHETGHNLLAHPARIGNRDKFRANWAMDIVLNQMLMEYFEETKSTLGAKLPPGGLYGPEFDKYKGWNWEKVYADDEGYEQFKKQCKQNDSNGGMPGFDEVLQATGEDGKPLSPEDQEALAREWTMAAQQAANAAKGRGKLPGFMEELIADAVKTKVDWRSQVRDAFHKVAKDEQSWQRFNRRYTHTGLYLPGLFSERLGPIGVYVDTSGSMGSEEFKAAIGCINEIMEDLKPERIMFGQCDTRMCSDEWLTSDDVPLTPRKFKGRGGTELSPMFTHVRTLDEELDMMVVVTDGQFGAIASDLAPQCQVVWIITTEYTQGAEQSGFGRIIRVEV